MKIRLQRLFLNQRIESTKRIIAGVIFALAAFLVTGAGLNDPLLDKSRHWFKPIPENPPELIDNPLTPEKIELGKMLFFEPRLSSSWWISCNSCHNLGLGGVDQIETSIGHGWQKGPRNSPTVYNAVFNISQFWDGRAKSLQDQAKGPMMAGIEMNNQPSRVVQTMKSIPEYVKHFQAAFPGEPDPVSFDNLTKALEAFEATLITPGARFDLYLMGDPTALTEEEKRGLSLFISKDCVKCHKGVNLGGGSYHRFGAEKSPNAEIMPRQDKGRIVVTRNRLDEYAFKSPTLRNIELTAPYFHSGKVWDLKEAVRLMGTHQLGIKLNDRDVDDITAFLKTLTGRMPSIEIPQLPLHRPDTPLPDSPK